MWVAAIKNMTFKYPILKECHCIINSSRINIFRQKKQYKENIFFLNGLAFEDVTKNEFPISGKAAIFVFMHVQKALMSLGKLLGSH